MFITTQIWVDNMSKVKLIPSLKKSLVNSELSSFLPLLVKNSNKLT
ncbi:hypothetical protein VAE122_3060160 [Vibrio aestuarianus]|nr:hypothetical protein VAE122_3060160 [Vibrio aestuarianus]